MQQPQHQTENGENLPVSLYEGKHRDPRGNRDAEAEGGQAAGLREPRCLHPGDPNGQKPRDCEEVPGRPRREAAAAVGGGTEGSAGDEAGGV